MSMALLEVDAEKFRRQMGRNTDTIGTGRDMVLSTALRMFRMLSEPAERKKREEKT